MGLPADPFYRVAESSTFERALVDDPALRKFVDAVDRFESAIGLERTEEPWLTMLRPLRRIRWQFLTLPLPGSHPSLDLGVDVAALDRWALAVPRMKGEAVGGAFVCALDAVKQLLQVTETPLGQIVTDVLASTEDRRLIVRSRRFASAVESWLSAQGLPTLVMDAQQGARSTITGLCCVIGVSRWHPAYLITASRALTTTFVHHNWLGDQERAEGILSLLGGHLVRQIPPVTGQSAYSPSRESDLELEVDWAAIGVSPGGSGADDEIVRVGARAILLAGGLRVFLEDDADSVIFVVQPGEQRGRRVRRERATGVEIGDFLLLRTERGRDDIIRRLADELLRDRAADLRAQQDEWKACLRRMVESRGYEAVLGELAERGVKSRNLRGWLAPDTLRTQSETDFQLIMDYCGAGAAGRRLWRSMTVLFRAHLIAGQRLRDALEREVESADLDEVTREGRLDITLPLAGAGALAILRVDAISPDVSHVPPSLLRIPEPISRDLWPE